jgi:hypothetical protein
MSDGVVGGRGAIVIRTHWECTAPLVATLEFPGEHLGVLRSWSLSAHGWEHVRHRFRGLT